MSYRKGFISLQTESKGSVGFKASVKRVQNDLLYPEYETKDINILGAFHSF